MSSDPTTQLIPDIKQMLDNPIPLPDGTPQNPNPASQDINACLLYTSPSPRD